MGEHPSPSGQERSVDCSIKTDDNPGKSPVSPYSESPMPVLMSRLILYVRDVELLKSFYQIHFGFRVAEEIENEWVVLKAGSIEIAFHRVGEPYRELPKQANTSNAKIVFSVESGLSALREKLLSAGVRMRDLKRYEGFAQLMCDGEDPEGNVFQLSQSD
ncbi:VOC family protein [Caballeronia sp. SBC2]|uniref:VOC family protein n=1 Tax=unclassified Caballeronia TaxID=2646786 RepID=UPI00351A1EA9